MNDSSLRRLPAVHVILEEPKLAGAIASYGREVLRRAVRRAVEQSREALRRGEPIGTDADSLANRALEILTADRPGLRPAINATGVLLHTGLGRAPLPEEAIEAIVAAARGYCNLEFDLATGQRGRRTSSVAGLICRLTGAEAATVVNNNAAATILALRALAAGREVVVSRGQLVEIGGSFRLPEIFAVSGARLREVGTTNKTRLTDYERAIGPETAALLRVHASNYRIVGFTGTVGIAELAALARSRGLWTIDDVGSGALGPGRPPGIAGEPTVAEGLAAGADLVLCSGDKLLGGPQCGLIVGRKAAIDRLESDPLLRAFRVDKLTLAALEATLRLALNPELAARSIPLWAFLTTPLGALQERAEVLATAWRQDPGLVAEPVASTAYLGGGSLPDEALPSVAVRIGPPYPAGIGSEGALAARLRAADPPVVGRIQGGAVLLDLRAVAPREDGPLEAAVRQAAASSAEISPIDLTGT